MISKMHFTALSIFYGCPWTRFPQQRQSATFRCFVSEELKGLPYFRDKEFTNLAAKADGLFEWARLACEYIKDAPPGVPQMPRFNALVNRSAGRQKNLLYDMFLVILKEIMRRDQYDDDEALPLAGFRSVMGQILGTAFFFCINSQ